MSNEKGKWTTYIAVIILAIVFVYPLWILIIYAFQPAYLTFDKIYPGQIPLAFTLSNLIQSFKEVDLIGPLTRSLEVAFMVGLIAVGLGIPAGYGLSKLTSALSNKLIVFLFIINMMPGLVIAIPISVYFLHANLDNTVFGVAFAQELVVLPLSVFIMLSGFRSLPHDLEYQARVDGASFSSTFFRLLMPMIRVPIMVAFLLAWMTSWDEFTYAIIISPLAPTFPVSLFDYVSRGEPFISASFALLVTIPVILIVVFLQKYLKGEYLTGGMKS